MPSGVSCGGRGGGVQSLPDVNSFSPLSSQLLLPSLPMSAQLIVSCGLVPATS